MPATAIAEPAECAEAPLLFGTLDLILEAYAIVVNVRQDEVAKLAITTALALGARLDLSDKIVFLMAESAVAEARRKHDERSS